MLNFGIFILRLNIRINFNFIITVIRLGISTIFNFMNFKIRNPNFLIKTRLTFIIKTLNNNVIGMQHSDRIIGFVITFSTFLLSKKKAPMIILITFLDLINRIIFGKTVVFDKIDDKLFLDIVRKHNEIFIGTKTSERVYIIFIIRETRGFETTISPLILFLIKLVAI